MVFEEPYCFVVRPPGKEENRRVPSVSYTPRSTHPHSTRLTTFISWPGSLPSSHWRNIAAWMRLPGWSEQKVDVLEMVHEWLSDGSNVRWTMVVDNADEAVVMFEPRNGGTGTPTAAASTAQSLCHFLSLSSHGSIVITSRCQKVVKRLQVFSEDILDVEPMEGRFRRWCFR